MKLKLIAVVALMVIALTLTIQAQAGEVVVCRNSTDAITSTELLDFYEGRVNRNIPHVFEGNISNEEYFTKLSSQGTVFFDDYYKPEILKMALNISEAITSFRSTGNTKFKGFIFTSEQLTKTSEDTLVMPPKNCQIEKALTLLSPSMPGDPEYIVQKEIVKNLSEDGVRGLITHAVFLKYLREKIDLRYAHQKLTAVSINDANFRYLFNALKKHLTVIGGYEVKLMSELPTGELFYNKSYVINDDGTKNREKTLHYGEFATFWHLKAIGEDWYTPTPSPKNWIITIQYEDGTIEEFRPNGGSSLLKLKHGKIKVNLFIPSQFVRPRFGILEQSLKYMSLKVAEKTIFPKVEVGLRSVNLTKTLKIELDQQNKWTAVEE